MRRLRYENDGIDAVDANILRALAEDARISVAELARMVRLSAPSVAERVRRLEENGVIEGYSVKINAAALGLPLAAWLRIRPIPGQLQKVAGVLQGLPEIVECDRITGEDCFIARAHVRSVADHPLRDDQHLDHPVLAGGTAAAADQGRRGIDPLKRNLLPGSREGDRSVQLS